MSKSYYTNTVFGVGFGPVLDCVYLHDVLCGNGINYRMMSVIVEDQMSTDIQKYSYSRMGRCSIFQKHNIHEVTLPFKVNKDNILEQSFKNEKYEMRL